VSTVRHAWPEVTKLLSTRSRFAIADEEESPARSAVTFTAGPMRGVRVTSNDGVLYVSRRGGPPRRAVGALRRYLLGAVLPDFGTTIVGAQALPPVVRAGRPLRHLRVRFRLDDALPDLARAMAAAGIPSSAARIMAREADVRPDVADLYVDPATGLLAERTEHLGIDVRMKTIVRAIGQDPALTYGTFIARVTVAERVTAVGGVTVERPVPVGTVADPDFVGRVVG
jgi:hypothetical protein